MSLFKLFKGGLSLFGSHVNSFETSNITNFVPIIIIVYVGILRKWFATIQVVEVINLALYKSDNKTPMIILQNLQKCK